MSGNYNNYAYGSNQNPSIEQRNFPIPPENYTNGATHTIHMQNIPAPLSPGRGQDVVPSYVPNDTTRAAWAWVVQHYQDMGLPPLATTTTPGGYLRRIELPYLTGFVSEPAADWMPQHWIDQKLLTKRIYSAFTTGASESWAPTLIANPGEYFHYENLGASRSAIKHIVDNYPKLGFIRKGVSYAYNSPS